MIRFDGRQVGHLSQYQELGAPSTNEFEFLPIRRPIVTVKRLTQLCQGRNCLKLQQKFTCRSVMNLIIRHLIPIKIVQENKRDIEPLRFQKVTLQQIPRNTYNRCNRPVCRILEITPTTYPKISDEHIFQYEGLASDQMHSTSIAKRTGLN